MKKFIVLVGLFLCNSVLSQSIGNLEVRSNETLVIKSLIGSKIILIEDFILYQESKVDIQNHDIFVNGDIIVKGKGEFIMRGNSTVYYKGSSDIQHPKVISLNGKIKVKNTSFFKNRLTRLDSYIEIYNSIGKKILSGKLQLLKDMKIEKDIYDIKINDKWIFHKPLL